MSYVMNALDKEQRVTVAGNHFTFKPRQVKLFQPNIATLLTVDKAYMGFVGIPEAYEDLEWKSSEEGQKALVSARKAGVEAYCNFLRRIVYNQQVSLRQDLEKMNIKADPKTFISDGELDAMKELVKYQASKDDEDQKKIDEAKELEKKLGRINI